MAQKPGKKKRAEPRWRVEPIITQTEDTEFENGALVSRRHVNPYQRAVIFAMTRVVKDPATGVGVPKEFSRAISLPFWTHDNYFIQAGFTEEQVKVALRNTNGHGTAFSIRLVDEVETEAYDLSRKNAHVKDFDRQLAEWDSPTEPVEAVEEEVAA